MINQVFLTIYGFVFALMVLKFLWKGTNVYILWRDGDSEVSPFNMLVGMGNAAIGIQIPYSGEGKTPAQKQHFNAPAQQLNKHDNVKNEKYQHSDDSSQIEVGSSIYNLLRRLGIQKYFDNSHGEKRFIVLR